MMTWQYIKIIICSCILLVIATISAVHITYLNTPATQFNVFFGDLLQRNLS